MTVTSRLPVYRQNRVTLEIFGPVSAFLAAVLLLLCASPAGADWNWQTPVPQGNTLLKVQFTDTTYGWAVGEFGSMIHTTDGGHSWYEQEYARTDDIYSVAMTSGDEGWAVGDNGTILHTIDGGDDWIEQTSGVSGGLNDVVFVDSLNGWAVGDNEVILHTSNRGVTWNVQHQNFIPGAINAITFLSPTEGWAVGSARKVYHTTDGGTNWIQKVVGSGSPATYSGITFADPSLGFIVGSGGEIWRTEDGGLTWAPVASGTTANLNAVAMKNSFAGWIGGDAGIFLSTINGGQSWSSATITDGSNLNSLCWMAGKLWATGELGHILVSTNSGVSWSPVDQGSRKSVNWFDFVSSTTGYAVGQAGLILRTTDGGTSWGQQTSPAPAASCYGVKFTDNVNGWAVGDNGTILRTGDGLNWSVESCPVTHQLFGITFANSTTGWIVGGEAVNYTGIILKTSDEGNSWSVQLNAVPKVLFGVAFASPTQGWAVGNSGYVLHTTDAGSTWNPQTSGTTRTLYWCSFSDALRGWAVGDSGTIIRTTNGGTSWSLQNSGVNSALYSIDHASNLSAIAVGDLGTILYTNDAGAHWQNQYSRTTNSLYGATFPSSSNAWACGDYGTVLHQTIQLSSGSVSGIVFNDANANAQFDTGEAVIPGWKVRLGGTRVDSTLAGGDGSFHFDNLPQGIYTLSEAAQPGWSQTYPVSPASYTFPLNPETTVFIGNFGNFSSSARPYDFRSGWNIVSVPLAVPDSRTRKLFPTANSAAFIYSGAYLVADTLGPGVGAWLKFPSSQTIWLTGDARTTDTIPVQADWNIIGSVSDSVPVASITSDPPGLVTSQFFGYNGSYYHAVSLLPSEGYWVKASSPGSLIISSSQTRSRAGRIRIIPTDEVPPGPPGGMTTPSGAPLTYSLAQNYPNPFNPRTHVQFTVAGIQFVVLKVYDVLGREVATLVNETKQPGEYSVDWDAGNQPSGVYYYRMTAGSFVETRKLVLIR